MCDHKATGVITTDPASMPPSVDHRPHAWVWTCSSRVCHLRDVRVIQEATGRKAYYEPKETAA